MPHLKGRKLIKLMLCLKRGGLRKGGTILILQMMWRKKKNQERSKDYVFSCLFTIAFCLLLFSCQTHTKGEYIASNMKRNVAILFTYCKRGCGGAELRVWESLVRNNNESPGFGLCYLIEVRITLQFLNSFKTRTFLSSVWQLKNLVIFR